MPLNPNAVIQELTGEAEKDRRAEALNRHKIYKDDSMEFLLEKVRSEFNEEAVKEMRFVPINILKKIINRKAEVYKKSPERRSETNQDLVDHYTESLMLDEHMQKADKYFELFANTALYVRLDQNGRLRLSVTPPYQYGVAANPFDQSEEEGYVFSTFARADEVTGESSPGAATGRELYNRNSSSMDRPNRISSNELDYGDQHVQYVFWTPEEHFTTDSKGGIISVDEKGDAATENPLGIMPIVHLTKERDNETYSVVGSDLKDLTQLLQLGWSDLMTIAKHQGFSLLTMTGPEAPTQMKMGINRGIFLKTKEGQPTPSVDYVTASSPLNEYKDILVEVLAMTLSSNDLNPQTVGGTFAANQATSGFHAMIQSADTLQAIESKKPVFQRTEKQLWKVIAAWHNYLFDAGLLQDEAKGLGKFEEDFDFNVRFTDIKPLESEQERIANVEKLLGKGLMTRKQALRKLHPDMSDDQLDVTIEEIKEETAERSNESMARFGRMSSGQSSKEDT